MSYSRSTGRLKVVVDGVKTADSYYDAIIDWAEEMSKKACYLSSSEKFKEMFRLLFSHLDVSTEIMGQAGCQCMGL